MALTIVETSITGGVDTHADVHVAAALDPAGGLLGVAEFPVTAAGYARLLSWLGGFGTVCLAGIEGTRSYGPGPARHLATPGIRGVQAAAPPPPGAPAGGGEPGRGARAPEGGGGPGGGPRGAGGGGGPPPRGGARARKQGRPRAGAGPGRPGAPFRPPYRSRPGGRDRIA